MDEHYTNEFLLLVSVGINLWGLCPCIDLSEMVRTKILHENPDCDEYNM